MITAARCVQFCLIVVVVAVHVLPTVDGWTLSVAVSGLPVRLKSRAASQEQRGGLVNLAAQVNPVEKFATNIRDAVAGVGSSSDASYHEERIRYHEERMRHH